MQKLRPPEKQPLDPVQDVVTRWWSTLAMVERLFELKGALSMYADVRNGFGSKNMKKRIPAIAQNEWTSLALYATS